MYYHRHCIQAYDPSSSKDAPPQQPLQILHCPQFSCMEPIQPSLQSSVHVADQNSPFEHSQAPLRHTAEPLLLPWPHLLLMHILLPILHHLVSPWSPWPQPQWHRLPWWLQHHLTTWPVFLAAFPSHIPRWSTPSHFLCPVFFPIWLACLLLHGWSLSHPCW